MRLAFALLVFITACSSNNELTFGTAVEVEGLAACANDGTDGLQHAGYRCATYRGIAGISMGGGAAMRIALSRPALFDVAVSLGSPYIDMEYFLLSVSEVSNGGFCSREQLLANLDAIDLKDDPRTWCGPVAFDELALENSQCTGFSGDYNHHYRGPSAGRGGTFNREGSFQIVQDLALAYGNPAFYNPQSTYLPPGISAGKHVPLAFDAPDKYAERNALRRDICDHPVRLERVYDRLYNPTGEYPVISFCDGDGMIPGEYEPGRADFPVEVVLAVDYNDNGRRDYGEPVISAAVEYYEDWGADNLPSDREPGYDATTNRDPAGDDYNWLDNPDGAENNFRFDPGEKIYDDGLDGVAGTGDYGEGNGQIDVNPSVARMFASSPRKLLEELDPVMLDRLHLWADAGIRDFLFSAQITNQFFGSLMKRSSSTRRFTDWSDLARVAQGEGASYDPRLANLDEATIGRHGYLRYGDPAVCPGVDEVGGRGNHVGTPEEVLNRLLTAFAFASARWPNGDKRALSDSVSALGSPNGSIEDFVHILEYDSPAVGRKMPYVVILPPDYYSNTAARYPVVYFLHGQGQKATDLAATVLLFLTPQMTSDDPVRKRSRSSDWQKMIIVLADGECQVGECHTGTFYVDHQGFDGDGKRFQEAFFELMRLVDRDFRTKRPEMLPL